MDLDQLRSSNRLIFDCIAGSHAYGTNTPESDIDYRGIFINPIEEELSLDTPPGQINDSKSDSVYYSLKKFFNLAADCNPNILELLYMPDDCIQLKSTVMDLIIENRHLFVAKEAKKRFGGYAYSQIAKAKGKNKRINNPQPVERPKKEDFCYIIDNCVINNCLVPQRPIPLKDYKIDLEEYHAAQLERCSNIFRLYYYGRDSKGIFRGDDTIACESISLMDELKFHHLMIYSKNEYESSLKEWSQYWEWVKNRNDARWTIQESDSDDTRFDRKNMSQCIRLLMSAEKILKGTFETVRLEGDEKDYVRRIRSGEIGYEALIEEAEKRMADLDLLAAASILPETTNRNAIADLYRAATTLHFSR